MLKNFNEDKAVGRVGEVITYNTLLSLGYEVEDVAEDRACRYKGDLIVKTDKGDFFIDVKTDNRIHETHNIVCEEENYFINEGRFAKGDMHKDYQYIAIVSQQARKIYFLDFKILQSIYKKGTYRQINRVEQINYCYLLPLHVARNFGAIVGIVSF